MYFENSLLDIFGFQILFATEVKQLLLAMSAGILIGAERGLLRKVATYRTFAVITTGSCVYTLLSVGAFHGVEASSYNYDVTRIAAQIVTGIGFVGAGVIFKSGNKVEGVTTAAMIWLAAAIGMACGFNKITIAIATIIIFCFLEASSQLIIFARKIRIQKASRNNNAALEDN